MAIYSAMSPTHGDIVEFQISPGQWRPAMLVRVWTDICAQLQVFPDRFNDGSDATDWARSSAMRGDQVGQWRPISKT